MNSINTETPIWSFVAMQYYGLILNRSYLVYVTLNYICGARVSGVVTSPLIGPGEEWYKPGFYINPQLFAKYNSTTFSSEEFLLMDSANFILNRSRIKEIEFFKNKWGMGLVPHSGRLVLTTLDRTKHEFILLGLQDAVWIREHLLQA